MMGRTSEGVMSQAHGSEGGHKASMPAFEAGWLGLRTSFSLTNLDLSKSPNRSRLTFLICELRTNNEWKGLFSPKDATTVQ